MSDGSPIMGPLGGLARLERMRACASHTPDPELKVLGPVGTGPGLQFLIAQTQISDLTRQQNCVLTLPRL